MSQAGRTRYFARSATRARSARRGKEKNKAPVRSPFFLLFHPTVKLYFVTVVTADVSFAGTDSKVDILLNGGKGDSGEIELGQTTQVPDPFERGRWASFSSCY